MNPDAVDYTPLEDIPHAWMIVMNSALHGLAWPLTVVITALGAYLSIIVKDPRAGIILLAFYFAYITRLVSRFKNQVWDRFAAANRWSLDVDTPPDNIIPPSLQFGHSKHFSPVIQANLGNLVCDLFTYDCTTGYGKSSQTHYFTVALTALPKAMPHIILDAVKDSSDEKNDIPNAQVLKLEGDFNNYFKLQIEPGQQIDVLTVLTPDVMQTLISYSQKEDIEMLGTQLFFIVNGDDRGPNDVRQLIRSVTELEDQLKENVRLSSS
jgi:hypothetical protein